MGWGRGASEDLSSLSCLCHAKMGRDRGLQGLYINKNKPTEKNVTLNTIKNNPNYNNR